MLESLRRLIIRRLSGSSGAIVIILRWPFVISRILSRSCKDGGQIQFGNIIPFFYERMGYYLYLYTTAEIFNRTRIKRTKGMKVSRTFFYMIMFPLYFFV